MSDTKNTNTKNPEKINPDAYTNDNPNAYLTLREYLNSTHANDLSIDLSTDEAKEIYYPHLVIIIDKCCVRMDSFCGSRLQDAFAKAANVPSDDENYPRAQAFIKDIKFAVITFVNFWLLNDPNTPQASTSSSFGGYSSSYTPPENMEMPQEVITILLKHHLISHNFYAQQFPQDDSLSLMQKGLNTYKKEYLLSIGHILSKNDSIKITNVPLADGYNAYFLEFVGDGEGGGYPLNIIAETLYAEGDSLIIGHKENNNTITFEDNEIKINYNDTTYLLQDFIDYATKVDTNITNIGDLTTLGTTDKSSLVNAINEVNQNILTPNSSFIVDDSETNPSDGINKWKTIIDYLSQTVATNTANIGDLTTLNTTAKDTLVNAINEVAATEEHLTAGNNITITDSKINLNDTITDSYGFTNKPSVDDKPGQQLYIEQRDIESGAVPFKYWINSVDKHNTNFGLVWTLDPTRPENDSGALGFYIDTPAKDKVATSVNPAAFLPSAIIQAIIDEKIKGNNDILLNVADQSTLYFGNDGSLPTFAAKIGFNKEPYNSAAEQQIMLYRNVNEVIEANRNTFIALKDSKVIVNIKADINNPQGQLGTILVIAYLNDNEIQRELFTINKSGTTTFTFNSKKYNVKTDDVLYFTVQSSTSALSSTKLQCLLNANETTNLEIAVTPKEQWKTIVDCQSTPPFILDENYVPDNRPIKFEFDETTTAALRQGGRMRILIINLDVNHNDGTIISRHSYGGEDEITIPKMLGLDRINTFSKGNIDIYAFWQDEGNWEISTYPIGINVFYGLDYGSIASMIIDTNKWDVSSPSGDDEKQSMAERRIAIKVDFLTTEEIGAITTTPSLKQSKTQKKT